MQLLQELYETDVGVCDHTKNNSPLSGVLFQPAEKFIDHLVYDQWLDLFLFKKIQSVTGITFDEFLNRPRYQIDKLVEGVDRFLQLKNKTEEDELRKLKGEASGLKT